MAERLPRHIIDMRDFSSTQLLEVLQETPKMEKLAEVGGNDQLRGKMYYLLFFVPSNLTADSFIRAVGFLGGQVREREVPDKSAWGGERGGSTPEEVDHLVESIADLRYDCVIMRGHNTGDAKRVAALSRVPVINAGELTSNQYTDFSQHPSQAIADLQTIYERHKEFRGLNIVVVGDVRSDSAVNSLLVATSFFKGVNLTIASSSMAGRLDHTLEQWLTEQGIVIRRVTSTEETKRVLTDTDVVYVARALNPAREAVIRASDPNGFWLNEEVLSNLPSRVMILHDMMRGEKPETASHPLAVWLRQRENNVFSRMALLSMLDYRPQDPNP